MNKYVCRAEASIDAVNLFTQLIAVVPHSFSYKALSHPIPGGGKVEFETKATLEQVRELVANVIDGHVMVETLQPAHKYTGERISS